MREPIPVDKYSGRVVLVNGERIPLEEWQARQARENPTPEVKRSPEPIMQPEREESIPTPGFTPPTKEIPGLPARELLLLRTNQYLRDMFRERGWKVPPHTTNKNTLINLLEQYAQSSPT